MKTYKMVILNKEVNWSVGKDVAAAEDKLNEYVSQGWELQQIVVTEGMGYMIAVMYKENEYYM